MPPLRQLQQARTAVSSPSATADQAIRGDRQDDELRASPRTSSWPKKRSRKAWSRPFAWCSAASPAAESRIACGKNLIAQMLCGSNSAKIKKLRLNQLSTFGLLWQLKQAEVATLIDILIAIGCLEQEDIDRFRPVLKLTPLGGDVMRGKAELPAGLKLPGELRLKLRRPAAKDASRRTKAATSDRPDIEPDHGAAWMPGRCRACESGGQCRPARPEALSRSVVETRTPDARRKYEVAVLRPGRCPGLSKVRPWTMRRGQSGRFLRDGSHGSPGESFEAAETASHESCQSPRRQSGSRPAAEQTPAAVNRPSFYWTWRLLSQGFPAEECLAIRGITRETLLDHVFQAAENGLEVRSAWCLPAETIAALDLWLGTIGRGRSARSWPNFRPAPAMKRCRFT